MKRLLEIKVGSFDDRKTKRIEAKQPPKPTHVYVTNCKISEMQVLAGEKNGKIVCVGKCCDLSTNGKDGTITKKGKCQNRECNNRT